MDEHNEVLRDLPEWVKLVLKYMDGYDFEEESQVQ